LKQAAISLGVLTEEQFDQWVIPSHMISPEEYKPKSNV
jgi:fumarate hydratase class II